MDLIKSVNYEFDNGKMANKAVVTFMNGSVRTFTTEQELSEIQNQLKSQQRQFLTEGTQK